MSKYDLVIQGGAIVDGTGKPRYLGDLGIRKGKIEKIGDLGIFQADRIIDAVGKVVTPGFIEPHGHADVNLRQYPESEGYTMQGVTTVISGNCGYSPAPLRVEEDVWLFNCWEWQAFNELFEDPYQEMFFEANYKDIVAQIKECYGLDINYKDMAGFFKVAESEGFSPNIYPLVGHNNLRLSVMGGDYSRTATPEEIEKMKAVLRRELDAGCRGMSTGLDYLPGANASTEELIELCKVVREYDGVYASHFRSMTLYLDGDTSIKALEGIEEAIRIGRESGVKVQVSHIYPPGVIPPTASLEEKLESARGIKKLFDDAIAEGVRVSYDVIPNTGGGGAYRPDLGYLLRPWFIKSGKSLDTLLKNLESPEYIQGIKDEVDAGKWLALSKAFVPDVDATVTILECKEKKYENKNLRTIMAETGWDLIDTVINIFKADPYTHAKMGLGLQFAPEWTEEMLRHPAAMPGGDNCSNNLDADYGLPVPLTFHAHPNAFCYVIKYLTDYCNKISLEEAVRHITGLPAEVFGIKDRGVLKEGNAADLVVFTPEELNANESYIDPRQTPHGIHYVIINGVTTVENRRHTKARAGQFLKA